MLAILYTNVDDDTSTNPMPSGANCWVEWLWLSDWLCQQFSRTTIESLLDDTLQVFYLELLQAFLIIDPEVLNHASKTQVKTLSTIWSAPPKPTRLFGMPTSIRPYRQQYSIAVNALKHPLCFVCCAAPSHGSMEIPEQMLEMNERPFMSFTSTCSSFWDSSGL